MPGVHRIPSSHPHDPTSHPGRPRLSGLRRVQPHSLSAAAAPTPPLNATARRRVGATARYVPNPAEALWRPHVSHRGVSTARPSLCIDLFNYTAVRDAAPASLPAAATVPMLYFLDAAASTSISSLATAGQQQLIPCSSSWTLPRIYMYLHQPLRWGGGSN
jgi:hypothetical protein